MFGKSIFLKYIKNKFAINIVRLKNFSDRYICYFKEFIKEFF